MPRVPGGLDETGSVTLDASGNGLVQLTPESAAITWYPAGAAVKVEMPDGSAPTPQARCDIYAGQTPTAGNFVDATVSGSSGDSTERLAGRVIGARRARYIWAVWTGGPPHGYATVNVYGDKDIP